MLKLHSKSCSPDSRHSLLASIASFAQTRGRPIRKKKLRMYTEACHKASTYRELNSYFCLGHLILHSSFGIHHMNVMPFSIEANAQKPACIVKGLLMRRAADADELPAQN